MRIHPLRASNHDLNGYFVIKNNQGMFGRQTISPLR